MERKLVVPEGMIKAISDRQCKIWGASQGDDFIRDLLLPAVEWLTDNPAITAPSIVDCKKLYVNFLAAKRTIKDSGIFQEKDIDAIALGTPIAEWRGLMFLAPELELPNEIKGLLWPITYRNSTTIEHNKAVIAAFEAGKEFAASGSTK